MLEGSLDVVLYYFAVVLWVLGVVDLLVVIGVGLDFEYGFGKQNPHRFSELMSLKYILLVKFMPQQSFDLNQPLLFIAIIRTYLLKRFILVLRSFSLVNN